MGKLGDSTSYTPQHCQM